MPTGEAAARLRAAQDLVASIGSASPIDDKLASVADGEEHRDAVAKFLGAYPAGLTVTSVDANVGVFTELPSNEEVKLFVVVTSGCPAGAMVRMLPGGERPLLDWPLFEQTHRLDYDNFVAQHDAPPRWFKLLCARSRSNDLTAASQESYLALNSQGSLSAKGESQLYVRRDSPAGRLLDSRMVWGRVYLIHALIGHGTIDQKPVLLLQDCEGAPPDPK